MDRAADEMSHHEAQIGAIRLHWVEAGPPDGPPVLLLHGFPEYWGTWRPQMGPLAGAGYRVIALDQRGYNLSEKPARVADYRIERLVDDVIGLLDHLELSRVRLVGHDWGGMVAWTTAMRHPERVQRLVVCSCPHPRRLAQGLRTPRQLLRSSYMFFFQIPVLAERSLAAKNFRAIRGLMRGDRVHPERWPDDALRGYVEALSRPGALTGALNWYRAAFRSPSSIFGDLQRISCPTLVIWGSEDAHLGVEWATPPPELVPEARLIVLHASHWLHHDAPDELAAQLLGFFAEDPPAPEAP